MNIFYTTIYFFALACLIARYSIYTPLKTIYLNYVEQLKFNQAITKLRQNDFVVVKQHSSPNAAVTEILDFIYSTIDDKAPICEKANVNNFIHVLHNELMVKIINFEIIDIDYYENKLQARYNNDKVLTASEVKKKVQTELLYEMSKIAQKTLKKDD